MARRPLKIGKTNDSQRYLAKLAQLCPRSTKMIVSMGPSFQITFTMVLKNPKVGHKLRVQDFDGWSGEAGKLATRHYTMRYDHT
jgi:hypothetical protein